MSWIFREGDQGHITLMNYQKLYRQSRVWVVEGHSWKRGHMRKNEKERNNLVSMGNKAVPHFSFSKKVKGRVTQGH